MNLQESVLWPFTIPYNAVVRLRALAYSSGALRQRRLDGCVISVGNLTVGGTGKTPVVLWIAQRLLAEGKSVGILTRGYRGKSAPRGTTRTGAPVDSTSDEVQLLRARLGESAAFGIGADRFASGRELSARGVQWFVLDDGFQHMQLARDVNIVLVDATNPFGGGHLLPAGRLREPPSALVRADIVVITRAAHAPAVEAAIHRDSRAPVFYARSQLDSVHGVTLESADTGARKFFAFCGIGNPSAFFEDLRDWNFPVVGRRCFPDHHRYTQQDASAICDEAHRSGADVAICTEKDWFNMRGIHWNSLEVFYCRVSMHFDREEEFWRAVQEKARQSVARP